MILPAGRLCTKQPACKPPGAAGVQDLQHKLVPALLERHGDAIVVSYDTPGHQVFVDELAVEPDLDAVIGADAKNTLRFLGHINLCHSTI